MKLTITIIVIIAVVILLGWLAFFIPSTPSPIATSTPPVATTTPPVATTTPPVVPTLPHCSPETLAAVAQAKADAKNGIHSYMVVENCLELK